MSLFKIIILILILMLLGILPTFPHDTTWGYTPHAGGIIVILLLAVLLLREKL